LQNRSNHFQTSFSEDVLLVIELFERKALDESACKEYLYFEMNE